MIKKSAYRWQRRIFGPGVGRTRCVQLRPHLGRICDAIGPRVGAHRVSVDRARGMVQDLVPEVRKNMHIIAKEEIEVQRLEEQIADTEARQGKEKDQVLHLKADLATGQQAFQYAGRSYTVDAVRTDLANRFERYKTNEATLASLKEIRTARQKSLEAARQKLEGMLASKRQLQVEVENLEARLQMIAAAKSTSNYQFDDSRLGRVKELVSNLRTRLEVAEKLVNAEDLLPRRDSAGQSDAGKHRGAGRRVLRREGVRAGHQPGGEEQRTVNWAAKRSVRRWDSFRIVGVAVVLPPPYEPS